MSNLSSYAVTEKWPATHPERLQLYSLPTPNGVKASIMLEEIELAYEPHLVSFDKKDQHSAEFLSVSPNNKIPAILDPNGPHGQPLALFESGAILLYLADKSGQLIPKDPAERYHCIQWLLFQVGGIGPMFGQLGYFVKFDGKDVEDQRPRQRYIDETKRLLGALDKQLEGKDWIMGGQYSIADIAVFPWIRGMLEFYEAGPLVEFENFTQVRRVYDAFLARPAVQRGLEIPARD
ncbi:MAG: glutathione binding-like protein [Halopseudomonas sp.]|uniref:glutathione binding-like protein n=1 Tax=Halopseudomonas sp. TaxID=2901191 RepID=UPI00300356A7